MPRAKKESGLYYALSLVTGQFTGHIYFPFVDVNEQDWERSSHPRKDQADI